MLPALLLIPLITATLCFCLRGVKALGWVSLAGSAALAAAAVAVVPAAFGAPLSLLSGMLYLDALSAYLMSLVVLLGLASSLYSISYLEHELQAGLATPTSISRYYGLLHLFIFTMLLVTAANNLALMWIAIEATTIVSAVLIGLGVYKRALAIEAAWKYIILCSVGIIFALLGTFITYYASTPVLGAGGSLNWTELKGVAGRLNPATMRLAFIFVLVGYGTKAGLAPVHNWLPDAHSQAPSPISALLSGILLNTAFYGILRFTAIVAPSTGSAFTGTLLSIFGMLSLGIAAIFILVQSHYKRLLAYSSIEHMGIISLGAGIGGPVGLYGALLHILNHALAKPLLFFASGKIQARYGSTRIEKVSGVLSSAPLLGVVTFIGVLALAGAPPFNIFISEFTILTAAVDKGAWLVVGLFLFFAVLVFYGLLAGFGRMLFSRSGAAAEGPEARETVMAKDLPAPLSAEHAGVEERAYGPSGAAEKLSTAVMLGLALLIIVLGLWVPDLIDTALRRSIEALGALS